MHNTPRRIGNRWFFPGGKSLPVVSGASDIGIQIPMTEAGAPQVEVEQEVADSGRPRDDRGRFTAAEQAAVEQQAAENAPEVGETNPQTGRTFTSEDVARIRQEEKDKLYSQIEAMRSQLDVLSKAEEERQRQIEEAQAEAARQAEEARKAEMTALERVTDLEQKFQTENQQLMEQIERERALFEQERKFAAIENYKAQRVAQVQEDILPELLEDISGTTEEEIEASISRLSQKTQAILANMQAIAGQQHQSPVPPVGPGPQVTAPPISQMDTQTNYQTMTPQQLRDMDMNTYAKERARLLQGVSNHARERGIYG